MNPKENSKPQVGGLNAWLIVGCAGLFYCYQFIIRVSPNVMAEELMQAFAIDAGSFGFMAAFYYYSYAGMQIPLGLIMDRFSPRGLLSLSAFTCGISCFVFAYTTNVPLASCARFAMGMGAACSFVGTLKLGTLWFKPRQIGNVISFTMIMGAIGAGIGGAPLQYLIEKAGWRFSLQLIGAVGILIGSLIYIFVQDTPSSSNVTSHTPTSEKVNFFSGLYLVSTNLQVWLISLFGLLMYTPLVIIGDLWGVSFIENVFGVPETIAATIITAMFIGGVVGNPLFTTISTYISKRRLPIIIGGYLSLFLFIAIVAFNTLPLSLLYIVFFLAGLFLTAKSLCWASICETIPLEASGVALGFSNMMVMLSGVIGHPLLGWLLDYHWDGTLVNGVPIYTANNYRFAFTMLPFCLGIAIIISYFIRETYPTTSDN